MKPVIRVENLSKQYRLGEVGTGTISHDLNRWWYKVRGKPDPYLKIGETNDRTRKGTSELVWALKDINFEVQEGEVLGIIGKNGAGKSTLLKILSRITGPTTGRVQVKGRIASLLEVGTGFHPELTGRENIYLNGTILGMRKREVDRKLEEIVDFAGVERYLDTPVKRYSSGMMVRLGFAVAAHLDPEILIVDEVLAVGDAEFQKKCLGKMKDVSTNEGRTVLFVSHNMGAVRGLCEKGVLITQGLITSMGKSESVIAEYLRANNTVQADNVESSLDRSGNGKIRFKSFWVENSYGDINPIFTTGSPVFFCFKLNIKEQVKNVSVGFSIHSSFDMRLAVLYSPINEKIFSLNNIIGEKIIRFKVDNLNLGPDLFYVRGRIVENNNESDWPKFNLGQIKIETGTISEHHTFSSISESFTLLFPKRTFLSKAS